MRANQVVIGDLIVVQDGNGGTDLFCVDEITWLRFSISFGGYRLWSGDAMKLSPVAFDFDMEVYSGVKA